MDALLYSAEHGDLDGVSKALESVDVNEQGSVGMTALYVAAVGKQPAMVRFLLDRGARWDIRCAANCAPLHRTAENNDVESARYLIDAGCPVDIRGSICSEGSMEETTLMSAAGFGALELVKFLVERGANVNLVDVYRRTALRAARDARKMDVVEYLLSAGAVDDVDQALELSTRFEEERRKEAEKREAEAARKREQALELREQGASLRDAKKFEEARDALERSVLLAPDDEKTRAQLCLCYLALKSRDKAIEQYREVKRLDVKLAKRLARTIKAEKTGP